MRVLLDECVHAGLKKALPRHKILTGSDMGWNGITNGRLLQLISGQFNLFITVDTKMPHQQNLKGLPFAPDLRLQSKIQNLKYPFIPYPLNRSHRSTREQFALQ